MNAAPILIEQQADPAQLLFDQRYITSSEICDSLGVSRFAIHVRRKSGHLPGAIMVNGAALTLWERDSIQPFLDKWRAHLAKRRGTIE